ncbi:MAG TPA: transglycosylase domain-containing protein [Cytophagaceae bacterium]
MKSPQKIVKILWISFASGLVLLMLFVFSVMINLFNLYGKIPGIEVLENPKSELAAEVFSSDYVSLGKYYRTYNRTPVELSEIAPIVVNTLIATEDVRFYNHSGVDFKGTFSIVFSALMGKKRGGSTITQQLAKNLFKMRDAEEYEGVISNNMLVVKVKEWITAIRLERAYTKKEIMMMYLNTVEFGHNSYGIKAAARKYFNTTPDKLTTEQAALLIGLLKGPSYYSPTRYPERSLNRRNTVLGQLVKYGYLSEADYKIYKEKPLGLKLTADDHNSGLAPYFRNYIKPTLIKWCKENGKNLYQDGLKIYTTIDSRMQKYAEEAVNKHMSYLQKKFNEHWKGRAPWTDAEFKEVKGFIERLAKQTPTYKQMKKEGHSESEIMKVLNTPVKMTMFTYEGDKEMTMSPIDSIKYVMHFLHTGMMSMDPKTGHIKAWVGDINPEYFKYDHVKQGKRQPGSTFKPIVYATAMELKNLDPSYQVMDVPVTYTLPDGKTWTPKNSNGKYSNDYVSLKQGLARSLNPVSAYLMSLVGPDSVVAYARRMGIESELESGPTLCLGTSDVSVYEMVNAYSVFVNEGYWVKPMFITRIEDKYGNVLEEFKTESRAVLNEQTAYNMVQLLMGSVEESGGTSTALKHTYKIPGEVGGKTGTTQGNADGWFLGITPDLVSGVWVGGETRQIRFRTMEYGQGAKMALPIWGLYMQKVYADRSIELSKKFKVPETISIRQDSTAIPGDSLIDESEYEREELSPTDFNDYSRN